MCHLQQINNNANVVQQIPNNSNVVQQIYNKSKVVQQIHLDMSSCYPISVSGR